jgi:hypothetical protein
VCAGRIHRNSCQPKESVTLQTFAALYTDWYEGGFRAYTVDERPGVGPG